MRSRKPLPKELRTRIPQWFAIETPQIRQQLVEIRRETLQLLLGHYRIDPQDPRALARLALELSMDYIPAFRLGRRRGRRPKKTRRKGAPGRPRGWHRKDYEHILRLWESGADRLRRHGVLKFTDKEALRAGYRELFDQVGISYPDRVVDEWAAPYLKRLWQARKSILDNAS